MKYSFNPAQSAEKFDRSIAQLRITREKESYASRMESGRIVVSLGVEKPRELTRREFVVLVRKGIVLAKGQKVKRLAVCLGDFMFPQLRMKEDELGELFAVNAEMANYEFIPYKTPSKEGWDFVEEIIVYGKVGREGKEGIKRGRSIGEGVNAARTLANTPGGIMTPKILAKAAKDAAQNAKVAVRILGRKEMEKLSMGGILGVAQGSSQEPQLIILEYKGAGAKDQPIVLVGKGITFDSGGINLKPEQALSDMHMDMAGGAAVMHAVVLASKLRIKRNVIGLVPAAENMPSGSSYRPGDIIKTMSGKTVEVLSTDAEGRIVMADAFTYAKRYNPKLIIDAATLTGSALAALGTRASALFATDEKLERKIREFGEESGDYVWPLPLWKEYEEDNKGTFADLNNTGKSRYGGVITAALFLKQFAEKYPWVHLDIAPRITSIEGEFLAKGATGVPVRLLVKILERI